MTTCYAKTIMALQMELRRPRKNKAVRGLTPDGLLLAFFGSAPVCTAHVTSENSYVFTAGRLYRTAPGRLLRGNSQRALRRLLSALPKQSASAARPANCVSSWQARRLRAKPSAAVPFCGGKPCPAGNQPFALCRTFDGEYPNCFLNIFEKL